MKKFKAIATKSSPKPEHVHDTMFIKGEVYSIRELPSIDEKVDSEIRQWRSEAGGMSVLCDDIEDYYRDELYKKFKAEEKFVLVEGKFQNSLGGFSIKEQSILRTTCKEFLSL